MTAPLTTERLVLTPFDPKRDWTSFVADLALDPVVTEHWADFADPTLTAAAKERIAAEEFLPWFNAGRALDLVVWTVSGRDATFAGVSGLMTPESPVGGSDPEFGACSRHAHRVRGSRLRRAGPCLPTRGHGWAFLE